MSAKVFISYNHKDRTVAQNLKQLLIANGFEVTIDSDAMQAGDDIKDFIEKCVRETDFTLSIVSKNSLRSAWVAMESSLTFGKEKVANGRFIACYIDPGFFQRSYTRETLTFIKSEIKEIQEEMSFRFEEGWDSRDLQDELNRFNDLKHHLPQIIHKLKNSLCVDIMNDNLEKNFPTISRSLRYHSGQAPQIDGGNGAEKPKPQITIQEEPPKPQAPAFSNYTEKVAGLDIQMVAVEGGTFEMGYKPERDGNDKYMGNAKPLHQATLSDFYISAMPVTIGQYMAFVNDTATHYPEWLEKSSKYHLETGSEKSYQNVTGNDRLPIVGVSWQDAQVFSQWLSEKTGKAYRLPTEAQWEFAARGGKQSKGYMYAGSNVLGSVAWFEDNTEGKTQPVGGRNHNELGLHDMSGNVWE
jgi:formylglycine-generating enzyme required for sulfatase activity